MSRHPNGVEVRGGRVVDVATGKPVEPLPAPVDETARDIAALSAPLVTFGVTGTATIEPAKVDAKLGNVFGIVVIET